MAAHRYWRATGLEAYATGDLELSCLHLLDEAGVRLDAPATLTASVAPTTGTVANLQDDDLATAARWPVQLVVGLTLDWDFGVSPVDASTFAMAGGSLVRFPLLAAIEYSDDATVWVQQKAYGGIAWPGANTKTGASVIVVSDTFDTDPTSRITPLSGPWVWSSATGALRYNSGSGGFLRFDGLVDLLPGMYMEMSHRIVTDPPARKHTGFFLVTGSGVAGIRIASLDGGVVMSQWVSSGENAPFASAPSPAAAEVVVGALVTWRVEYLAGGVFKLSLNGTLRLTGTLASITGPLKCGIYGFGGIEDTESVTVGPPDRLSIKLNFVKGRASSTPINNLPTGTVIVYGTPYRTETLQLLQTSGAVKDTVSGVLGKGRGRVAGTIKETPNSPVFRKVRLIREIDGLLLRELWSDPITGAYSFDYVDELQKFTVLSYDHTGAFRAVVADGQIPELIA